jgi:hypothetical protein
MTRRRDLVDVPFDPANHEPAPAAEAAPDEPVEKALLPLACRLNLWHHWDAHTTEDGSRYHSCRLCGAYPRPPGWV